MIMITQLGINAKKAAGVLTTATTDIKNKALCNIADALVAAGVEIDKKDITIVSDSVKELGTYEASVKCYKDIKGTVKFEVVAE